MAVAWLRFMIAVLWLGFMVTVLWLLDWFAFIVVLLGVSALSIVVAV